MLPQEIFLKKGNDATDKAAINGAENKDSPLAMVNTPIPGAITKDIIYKAIKQEWKRKWQSAPH